jgi:hypothetical protein
MRSGRSTERPARNESSDEIDRPLYWNPEVFGYANLLAASCIGALLLWVFGFCSVDDKSAITGEHSMSSENPSSGFRAGHGQTRSRVSVDETRRLVHTAILSFGAWVG